MYREQTSVCFYFPHTDFIKLVNTLNFCKVKMLAVKFRGEKINVYITSGIIYLVQYFLFLCKTFTK